MLPVIAIVGRPNVGKSTLFNRLTKTRIALVGNFPGLTRDRQYGDGSLSGKKFIVIDTGGINEINENIAHKKIEEQMTKHAWLATKEADAVLFMVDARGGLNPEDTHIANKLRKLNKKIFLVINKTDGLDVKTITTDFYELGFKEQFFISAEHGRGVQELLHSVVCDFPAIENLDIDSHAEVKIAFVGRPNVGKSTLINRILGEERVIVSDIPGTTRDSIFINLERRGKKYTLIDTAGVRRRGKIYEKNEKFSVIKSLQSIETANVVVMLFDATENVTDQDLRLLGYVLDSGKALVISVNKWDNLPTEQREKIHRELERRLTFVNFADIHFISALHGTGVGNIFKSIDKAYLSATKKLKTPEVPRVLERAIATNQPPLVNGRRIKLRYAHVGGHNPPLIIIHGNQTESVPDSYRRYLENYFRKALRISGTPIRIEFRTSKNPYK
jgi:GTPase